MDSNEIQTKQVKWYESSNGSGNLALSVKGASLAFIPLIISILRSQGVEITEEKVTEVIEQVFTLVSVAFVLLGTVRKAYYAFKR